VLKTARRIIFVLVPLRTYFSSVLILMLAFNFMAATLFVSLFEGVLDEISNALDTEAVRISSFANIGSAMLALMQVLIGEGWHELMFAIMNAYHSWFWSIPFLLFVLVQTLLLTNLLVGVILDSTTNFEEEDLLQQQILLGDQLEELAELRQGYAQAQQRTVRADEQAENEAAKALPNRLSAIEQSLRRSSESGGMSFMSSRPTQLRKASVSERAQVAPTTVSPASGGGRRTSVSSANVAPSAMVELTKPRTNFELLPQLTSRHLGTDARRRRMTANGGGKSAPGGLLSEQEQKKAALVVQNAVRRRKKSKTAPKAEVAMQSHAAAAVVHSSKGSAAGSSKAAASNRSTDVDASSKLAQSSRSTEVASTRTV